MIGNDPYLPGLIVVVLLLALLGVLDIMQSGDAAYDKRLPNDDGKDNEGGAESAEEEPSKDSAGDGGIANNN